MVNRFLRTASTRRLLATLAGIVVVIAGGAAIALAATSGGPVPKPKRLAVAIRDALAAKPVKGISADVKFTDNLFPSFEIQGSDPLLTGGSGHIWVSRDGRLRLELYGDNGDPEIVVTHSSWWIYDPTLDTVYQGKLARYQGAADTARMSGKARRSRTLPSVSQIQSALNQLAVHLRVTGAIPSDVGGQPAFTVKLSPRSSGGLIGQLQIAWDALQGVPLRFAVYARGNSNPVLELAASGVSYGTIAPGIFKLKPPAGAHVVTLATPTNARTDHHPKSKGKATKDHAAVTGVTAVSRHLSFKLAAPPVLAGLRRQSVSLLNLGSEHGALITYGQGLGGVAVIEEPASQGSQHQLNLNTGSGEHAKGIMLPTVSVNGTNAQQLDTAIGTILRFTSGAVGYTVLGSVPPGVADAVARGL